MTESSRLRKIPVAALLASVLVLAGCTTRGANVRFATTVVPPLPNVLPDTEEFKLAVSVVNQTGHTFPAGALEVNVQARYFTDFASEACLNALSIPLGHVVPEQVVTLQSVSFQKLAFVGDPCRCLKGICQGHLILSLTNAAGVLKPGPKTRFQITWKKSGSLADLSVVDQSD